MTMKHRCMKNVISGCGCFIISFGVWCCITKSVWDHPREFSINDQLHKKENLFVNALPDIRKGRTGSTPGILGNRTGRILWYQPPNFQHIIDAGATMKFSTCGFPNSCSHVLNSEFINISDAVIFHGSVLPSSLPKRRKDQFWIFYTLESPNSVHAIRNEWRTQFDWVMNYRRDSDIFLPYGKIFKREQEENMELIMKRKEKEHPVAWLVSNCNAGNGRQQYVNKMKKHINVNVYGKCGTPLVASYKNTSIEAYQILSVKYKFYLSFENNHCKDYMTEKIFNTYSRTVPLVPVVRGGGLYDKVLPPGTYINTADFKSPEHLAKYLDYLNNHDEEYLKILREKLKYDVYSMVEVYHQSLCQICEKIQTEQIQTSRRDVSSWIRNKTCVTVNDVI